MADQKLSQRIQTFIRESGLLHIILPSGGGFASWKISPEYITGVFKERFASKSADFTESLDADTLLTRIDLIFVTGAPVIKVGTTLAGNDVISGRTLSTVKNSMNILSDYFKTAKTLYFTITGGTVDIIITQQKNYNT